MKRLMLISAVAMLFSSNLFAELEEDYCYRIQYSKNLRMYRAKCEEKDGKYILHYVPINDGKYAITREFDSVEARNNYMLGTNILETDPNYRMPGGKGSLDRILGRDPKTGKVAPPREVTMEEAQMINAKNQYKQAKAGQNQKRLEAAQEQLKQAQMDVELSKAKIKDLEEKAKEKNKK